MKVIIPCHCLNQVDFEYDEEVVIDENVKNSILSGNFMTVECGKCGITLKPEFPVLFKYDKNLKKIFFVPELQRDSFLMGKSSYIYRNVDRFVIGFLELAEKLIILEAGLDDIAVECIKYYIFSKIASESTDSDSENEISIYFDKLFENTLVFQIHGLKDKEIGMLKISMDYYETIAQSIGETVKEEPYSSFLTPPYVSVLRIYRDYPEKQPEVQ